MNIFPQYVKSFYQLRPYPAKKKHFVINRGFTYYLISVFIFLTEPSGGITI